ncbi:MAG TPA: hypothetical protein VFK54_12090 [Candidatus Limnocylindrales bacterium]|nr:hypothetical protein [Candidatus Limnocylindrales bacterium]
MNAEFDWWLLLVGAVAGAALAWLVLADSVRREEDVANDEIAAEAGWIRRSLAEDGDPVDAAAAERVLRAHRRYLRLPPPDALVDPAELDPTAVQVDPTAVQLDSTAVERT